METKRYIDLLMTEMKQSQLKIASVTLLKYRTKFEYKTELFFSVPSDKKTTLLTLKNVPR